MTPQEIQLKLAQGLYKQRVTLANWDLEQDHVRWHWLGQAENIVKALDGEGLVITKKPEMVVKTEEPPRLVGIPLAGSGSNQKAEKDDTSEQESEGEETPESDSNTDSTDDEPAARGRKTGSYGRKRS